MSDVSRRDEALDTAFGVFLRFGYRKTSMDDVARAVGVSRQGLYHWFPNKAALFMGIFERHARRITDAVDHALSGDGPLADRLVDAFDAFIGDFVGANSTDAAAMEELLLASKRLIGERMAELETDFARRIVEAVEPHGTLSAQEVAELLLAVSYGCKHRVASRDEYRRVMRNATRLVC